MCKILVLLLALIVCAAPAFAAEKLPAPKTTGGPSVLEAIEKRASASSRAFPTGDISRENIATLLWAASGRNREGTGWTVPTAMGKDPYCAVYLADKTGVYRYDGREHALTKVSGESILDSAGSQSFVKTAPCLLIFVTDGEALAKFGNAAWRESFGPILVGAMTQNVYLAARALDVEVRYVASLNADVIRKTLGLKPGDVPVCILPIGSVR